MRERERLEAMHGQGELELRIDVVRSQIVRLMREMLTWPDHSSNKHRSTSNVC